MTSEPRRYDQARCAWCPDGDEKNAHIFVVGHRISPACPQHAAEHVLSSRGQG